MLHLVSTEETSNVVMATDGSQHCNLHDIARKVPREAIRLDLLHRHDLVRLLVLAPHHFPELTSGMHKGNSGSYSTRQFGGTQIL